MTPTDRSSSTFSSPARARLLAGRAWLGPVIAVAVYLPGALYVLSVNRWHLTAPVVMLLLCWAAVLTLGYHLTRMAVVVNETQIDEAPVTGSRDELEREKKKLVRGIKEVEFDRECGKMSDADATALIATYRTRAIDILRELERLDADRPDTPRARVEADLKARVELEQKLAQAGRSAKAKAKAKASKAGAAVSDEPVETAGAGAAAAAATDGSDATEPSDAAKGGDA